VQADANTFNTFAAKVQADTEGVFRDYEITDKASMRQLLGTRLDLQQLSGDYKAALETVKALRALEDKPSARLTTGLFAESELKAAIDTNSTSSSAYEQAFTKNYGDAVNKLPWDVVQDSMKSAWAGAKLRSKASLIAFVKTEIDPAAEKSKALNGEEAADLIAVRRAIQFDLPLNSARIQVLGAYVSAHNVTKPDIWEAREVTLNASDKLTPVLVGIWDSGVDVSIFDGQVFADPNPTPSGSHGLAYLDDGGVSHDWLYPLTDLQQKEYPTFRDELKGRLDLESGIDSPETQALQKKWPRSPPNRCTNAVNCKKSSVSTFMGPTLQAFRCEAILRRGSSWRVSTINFLTSRFSPRRSGPARSRLISWKYRTTSVREKCGWSI
jgi:hypothetical protein